MDAAIARQRLSEHISVAAFTDGTIKDAVFPLALFRGCITSTNCIGQLVDSLLEIGVGG
jgi:hypothetical protein